MSKYKNVRTTIGTEKFDSKREALRHLVLKDMEKQGEIGGLRRQPKFVLKVSGQKICTYVGDWEYWDLPKGAHRAQRPQPPSPGRHAIGCHVVEDSKGVQTRDFKIKWKLCQALYPEIEWRLS